jgi:hypothetical protein
VAEQDLCGEAVEELADCDWADPAVLLAERDQACGAEHAVTWGDPLGDLTDQQHDHADHRGAA